MAKNDKKKIKKPTIKLVAYKAGVSIGTVSRVLNNRPGVKTYTKEKVLTVMKELGYQPDLAARELVTGSGLTIGLNLGINIDRQTPFYFLFQESIANEVIKRGFRFLEIFNRADGLPETLTNAMILLGAHDEDPRIDYLKRNFISLVLIGRGNGLSCVAPDDFNGGYQAAQHLLRLGHEDILFLSGLLSKQAFYDRYAGFNAALNEMGIQHEPDYLMTVHPTSLEAYRIMRRLLRRNIRFSAVFAATDEMAIGVIAALEDAGLKVPEDISVVGYDDLPEIGKDLTTIRQDISLIAHEAVKLILNEMEGRDNKQITLPVQLIARKTTARNQ